VGHSERLWPARLRWRLRGAWLWPAFAVLTLVDGALIATLPPYDGAPEDIVGATLVAGFLNLFAVAVAAPFGGWVVRHRRPDLPRMIATNYAGTALLAIICLALFAAGMAHRPAIAARDDDRAAVAAAVHGYVTTQAAEWAPGLDGVDAAQLAPEVYRACVPGADPRRALCLIVDTDQRPAGVTRDGSMVPNVR
jgi:hypothetical protein